ncbi:hypothetical protein Trydic_g16049 [Trypoxylus dichotomus]
MSAELDPAKLKVVELRSELSARGLDTKGNKPVLVKRLKDALEEELKKELPDTSIADTSTEDLDISPIEESEKPKEEEQKNVPVIEVKKEVMKTPEKIKEAKTDKCIVKDVENKIKSEKPVEKKVTKELDKDTEEPAAKKPKIESSPVKKMNEGSVKIEKNIGNVEDIKAMSIKKEDIKQENKEVIKMDEGTSSDQPEDNVQVKIDESAVKTEIVEEIEKTPSVENAEEAMETGENECADSKLSEKKEESKDSPQRGDKRKRSPSPNRSQRRRSKSPIKEDEPIIDNNKVQLNWYDSDLHLQIDKESFLSGKPYHDGAFGYIWSGTRATHGADTGKVCYEVKITEELKWEDFIRQPDRGRRDRERKESRRDRLDKRDKSSDKKKSSHKSGDKKDSKHKDKSKEEKSDEDNHEKIDEAEIAKEEDTTQIVAEDKNTVESESNVEEKQENVSHETNSTEMTEGSKVETDQMNATTQKDEKTVEAMEVDETKGDEKEEEKKAEEKKAEEKKVEEKKSEEKKVEEKKAEEKKIEEKKDEDESKQEIDKEEKKEGKENEVITPVSSHLIRIGWSSLNSGLQLGESKFSYGYESSGKFVYDKNFTTYGKPFAVGDVVGAYLEFTEEVINIKYTLNGEELPIALSIPKIEVPEENFSLFPHVLSRNYAFEVNLGGRDEPFFSNPESSSDYVYIDKFENKVLGPTRPETRGECEVIMMCGLPASGKTHWVNEHVANNPDKRYTVIGNTQLLEKMTVNGNPLKNTVKGRWNLVLEKLSKCLNKLVEVAALRRRNYVIDQTNVFPSAQRRKMRPFEGFKRRAVIVVCGDEEQARRRALQEAQDGKDVPNIAVYEMKANMSLPKVGDWLEEVTYVELDEQQAKTVVQKYNKEGRDNGFGPITQRRDYRDDRAKWNRNRRNDYRGGYRERNYQINRFDRGSKSRGSWQPRSGSWNRNDRRDNRGSSNRPREWRNNNRVFDTGNSQRHQDRGREQSSRHNRDGYRSRPQGSGRSQSGNWQSGGGGGSGWGGSGSYSSSQGSWQSPSGHWNQNYGGQGKWSYGQGGGYGQNYHNWNYLSEYQSFIGQNPQQSGANNGRYSGGITGWSQR